MTGGLSEGWGLKVRICLVIMIGTGILSACGGTTPPPVTTPKADAREFGEMCPRDGPPATPEQLKACVPEFDTLDIVGDEQRLMLDPPCPGSCRYGPLAKIEPAKRAHEYTEEELREGRIIARLFVRPGEEGYRKLGLIPGRMTYWWVQKQVGAKNGRSLLITETTRGDRVTTVESPLYVDYHPVGRAIARWVWVPDDETSKGTCGAASCKR